MENKGSETKPVIGQIEDHTAGGRYQPCRWTGSAWVPVAARKPVARISEICPRCHSYCYGDCAATR
jgi:hypothetical protein